ncbi:MAG: ATP-binding protein [Candidatus Methanoperedens sp.]|nr:ATP-binding protein [Candidatus Methanoperedens sp. BLZ2]KAB2946593.1 MAG: ATP-binding protein [Candidatus Methanoperedens sp.]MBZ0173926.1 ATP-binding protein [Candidatus Methanoperedens nitroreducens]MCX9078971.1 ATP-binding protein [Candidatus Methanoperedens sp.]
MNKEILVEWNPHWEETAGSKLIERELVRDIEPWLERKEILGFLGVRRSGKTTLMSILINLLSSNIPRKNILFIKCDDDRIQKENLIDDALKGYMELVNPQGKIFVFIDEVQEIDNWENTLKRIYDLEKGIKLIISGSNFSMQKDDFSFRLAGRIAYFEVYPLSFKEFLKIKIRIRDKIEALSKKDEIKHYLFEYMEFGGFPEVVLEKNPTMKKQLLQFYFDTIIYRDIIKKRDLRSAAKMERMINIFLQNISNPMNFSKVGKDILLSVDTVGEYAAYLGDAYLVFTMPIFSFSVKAQEINPKKIYCIDSGIRNIKGFRFSLDYGRIAENIVFIELKRRTFSDPLSRIFYWHDKKQKETDFLLMGENKVSNAIQVCWEIIQPVVKKREVEGMLSVLNEFNLECGLIITEDYEGEEIIGTKKISYMPLWLWLLRL